MEARLRAFCFDAPHWMQIQIQGLWYGLISWRIQCAEDGQPCTKLPLADYIEFAEPELKTWPYEWLQETVDEFMKVEMTLGELNTWFETLHTIFQETIPTDLNIFMILSEGATLSEEQWKRLYDAVAFVPPQEPTQEAQQKESHPPKNPIVQVTQQKKHIKTRRIHGRRAITPIKGRRAHTHHKQRLAANVVKLK
jgi:hypothetical protein